MCLYWVCPTIEASEPRVPHIPWVEDDVEVCGVGRYFSPKSGQAEKKKKQ